MKVVMFGVDTGSETHVHCERYLRLLQLAGCDVTFVEYRGVQLPDIPNVTYLRLLRHYRGFEKWLGTRAAYFLRKQAMQLLWRLVRPDICHVQWIDENYWHIARAGLRPLVATVWGSDIYERAELSADDPLRQKVAAALRLTDNLIVDSDDVAATAEQIAGQSLCTTLLPIGIDTEQFRPSLFQQRKDWREKLGIDPGAIVLISARRSGPLYRQPEIIRAFAALDRSHHKQIYLIIRAFGGDVSSIPQLHRLADSLNVSHQVRWVGEVEYTQLPGLYAASDIAINFPIMDGFPVTFLECFACGLPVVSNRLVSYESNGAPSYLFFVEDDSVGGLKTGIEAAIERLDHSLTRTAEAREHVVRNFDERVTARVLRQTYEAILAKKTLASSLELR